MNSVFVFKNIKVRKAPFFSLMRLENIFVNRSFPSLMEVGSKQVKIFVLSHKIQPLPMCFDHPKIYVPMLCGGTPIESLVCDSTGDNISSYNKYINEMTAIYWLGKHYDEIGNPDYIGINHYRRHLDWTARKLKPSVLFANAYIGLRTNGDFLSMCHGGRWLELFISRFGSGPRGEFGDIEKYLNHSRLLYMCNMFLTDRNTFRRYFSFIEYCINIAVSIIDENKMEFDKMLPYDRRAFSFILERMTSFWIWHEKRSGRINVVLSQLQEYKIQKVENSIR